MGFGLSGKLFNRIQVWRVRRQTDQFDPYAHTTVRDPL